MSQIIMQIAGWLISPILAFVIGRLTIKLNSLQAYNAKKDEMAKSESVAIKETCKYVLKKSLKDDYDFYVEQQGWCSVVDKAEVEKVYKIYSSPAINGNGQGTRYYHAIMDLPEHPTHERHDSEE